MVIPPRDVYSDGTFLRDLNTPVKGVSDAEFKSMMSNATKAGAAETAAGAGMSAAEVSRGIGFGVALSAAGIAAAQPRVSRSGTLASDAGRMCIKEPFILIKRNEGFNPNNNYIGNIEGKPSYQAVSKLNACKGYTVVKEVKLVSSCTDAEAEMIEAELKKGVYL